MAHTHKFQIGDSIISSAVGRSTDGDHIHIVRFPNGQDVTSSKSGDSPNHTHVVTTDGSSITSGPPIQADAAVPKKSIQAMARDHNAKHPARRVSLKILQEVQDRGEAGFETSARPGISREAWGIRRVRAFLNLASSDVPLDPAYTHDNDLLPSSHPIKRDIGSSPNPWASLEVRESELSAAQVRAVNNVTRSSARKMTDAELATAHGVLVKLHDRAFAGNTEELVSGFRRIDVVRAAAAFEEELERRGLLGEPGDSPLFVEASEARERHIRRSMACKAVETVDGTFLELPGGPVLIHNRRVPCTRDLLDAAVRRWSSDGSRYHKTMRSPHTVPYSVPIEMSASEITDGIELSEIIVEKGAMTEEFEEFFLSGNGVVRGIVKISRNYITFSKSYVPYVLTTSAMVDGWMPPDGESALPASLELDFPPEFRYWKATEDADSQDIRDYVVSSKSFNNIGILDGDFRRLVSKQVVPNPYPVAPSVFSDPDIGRSLIDKAAVCLREGTVARVYEAKTHTAGVSAVTSITDDYLLSVPVDKGAVEALETVGRPFYIDGQSDRVFVSSVPLVTDAPVVWADTQGLVDNDVVKQARGSAVAQTLIFSKESWDRQRAISWARAHDFRADKVDETAASYRLRQRDPGDFQGGTFRTTSVPGTTGIQMVVGRLKSAAKLAGTSEASEECIEVNLEIVSKVGSEGSAKEERIVYGVVLQPGVVDAQNDVITAEDIEKAAHKYMESFQNIGLQHKQIINQQTQILESFIAPVDFKDGGQTITEGSWVMKVRVLSDVLWRAIKDGKITGFSIGGTGIRTEAVPEAA